MVHFDRKKLAGFNVAHGCSLFPVLFFVIISGLLKGSSRN